MTICFLILFALAPMICAADAYYFSFVPGADAQFQEGDVQLYMEKAAVPVASLRRIDTAQRTAETLSHPAGRRTYLLFLDFLNLSPPQLLEVRKSIQVFLERIPLQDLIAVAAAVRADGFRLLCAPTTDRNQVMVSLNLIGKEREGSGYVEGPEGNLYPETLSKRGGLATWISDDEFHKRVSEMIPPQTEKESIRPLFLQSLVDLGFLLSTMEGRKNLLIFSGGVGVEGLSVQLPIEQKKKVQPEARAAQEMQHEDLDAITDTSSDRLQARANLPGTRKLRKESPTILPELYAGSDTHVFILPPADMGVQEIARTMAEKTGGKTFSSNVPPREALEEILNTDATFYVIGINQLPDEARQLSEIRIEAKGRSVKFSPIWLLPKSIAEYTSTERRVSLAESIYKDVRRCSDCRLMADTAIQDDQISIPIFLEIPAGRIIAMKDSMDFEFQVYVLSEESIVDYSYFQISLDLKNKKLMERLRKSGLRIWNVMGGKTGKTLIRCILRDQNTGILESIDAAVEIPDSGLAVSQPFFPSTNFDWVLWPKPEEVISRRGMTFPYPYRTGKDFFYPDLSPVIKKNQSGPVFHIRYYRLNQKNNQPPIELTLNAGEKSSEIQEFGLLQTPELLSLDSQALFWKLTKLPDLSPGPYTFQVRVIDRSNLKDVVRNFNVRVE